MARNKGMNKSRFIREWLAGCPVATLAEVRDAWADQGDGSKISGMLFYAVRKQMRAKATAGETTSNTSAATTVLTREGPSTWSITCEYKVDPGYEQIELRLDELIRQAEGLDRDLVEALRIARRRVGARLIVA